MSKATNSIIYNNIKFSDDGTGHYRNRKKGYIHRYIWEKYNNPIPNGYVIHHKDEDPSNNEIDNLQLMTNSEHVILHNTGRHRNLGKRHTDQAKKNMSESKLGQLAWNKGKNTSEEVRMKQSESAKKRAPMSKETKLKLSNLAKIQWVKQKGGV